MIDLYKVQVPCYRENEFDQQLTCCRPLRLDSPNFTVAQKGFKKTTTALLNVSNYFSTEPTAQNKATLSRFTTSVRKLFETIVALFRLAVTLCRIYDFLHKGTERSRGHFAVVWSTPQKRLYSCSGPGVGRWSIAVCKIIIASNPLLRYQKSSQDIFQKTAKFLQKASFLFGFFLSRLRIRYLWAVNPISPLIFKAPVKQKKTGVADPDRKFGPLALPAFPSRVQVQHSRITAHLIQYLSKITCDNGFDYLGNGNHSP